MRNLFVLAVTAAIACTAVWASQGPLPGDVALTLALQGISGSNPDWAEWLTGTAKAPLLWGTLAVAAALAFRVSGLRAALAVPIAYGLAFAADKALRAVIFAPRPDPALVAVADPAASSGLPSTFGLVYGAMFGVALLAPVRSSQGAAIRIIAVLLLVAGACARILPGGHWPSQMAASIALGLLLASAARAIVRSRKEPDGGDTTGSDRSPAARPDACAQAEADAP